MNDRLEIRDLVAHCRLGVHDWEQKTPQPVWIDLDLEIDVARAAAHDDVREAVDYGRLVTVVRQYAEQHSVHLLETLAEAVAGMVLETFAVPTVRVRMKKRALPNLDYAAIEIVRAARV